MNLSKMFCLESLIIIFPLVILISLIIFMFHFLVYCSKLLNGPKIGKISPFKLATKPPYQEEQALESLWKINSTILETLEFEELTGKIANIILQELTYLKLKIKAVVFTMLDEKEGIVRRISVSHTPEVKEILQVSPVPFQEIKIPLKIKENILVKVIKTQKPDLTHDLSDVFVPVATRKLWRDVQKRVGIKTSLVFPLLVKGKCLGAIIFSVANTEEEIIPYEKEVLKGFVNASAIAVENSNLHRELTQKIEELRKTNIKLKELDEMKDEFVSIASHELRTPMTSIKNYVWMALYKNGSRVSRKQRLYLERAAISTERLINLVEDMLTVSRIEGGRLETKLVPGDIVKLSKSFVQELKPKAEEKEIRLILKSPEKKTPLVLLDKERIRQVLFNLIGNAIKFTGPKGKIIVSFEKKDKTVSTLVSDTGRGIAKADIPKLFKKFGRLDRSFATIAETVGTGLGLYICKQIIDLHKGKIGARSKLGEGSTFYFDLRVARG